MKTNWDTKFMGDEPKLMSKYKHQQAIDEFRKKFVKNVTKQVDTSNSIVLPMWKDNHSHLSRDIEQFLDEQLTKKEEEVIENLKMKELPEFYEQAIKVTYGWAQDLDVDDARIGYNQAVKELNKKIEQLKTQTKK